MQEDNILVWLPSPLGDSVLCTPALRAIRQHFKDARITFLANNVVREVLSSGSFNDAWLEHNSSNPFAIASMLKGHDFSHAVLFKNSFASALAVLLAGIPSRTGYVREGRGFLLTEKLYPSRDSRIAFKPVSMVDYYLAIASWLGCDTPDTSLELTVETKANEAFRAMWPEIFESPGPVVVLVPGGAFGPSKCWPSERFAQTADWLIDNYRATVVVSVSPAEKHIAKQICDLAKHNLINIAEKPLNVGMLKSLLSAGDLLICNDTGPRHIAIALKRKVITLFGPNNPQWTDTDYENEIKIIGDAPCIPCDKPTCRKSEHLCMQSITVEMVCRIAKGLLENSSTEVGEKQKFKEISQSFFVDENFEDAFSRSGLTSIDEVFSFDRGENLIKENLSAYRSRLRFEIDSPETTLFLKRYDKMPVTGQLKNWFYNRRRISCGFLDFKAASVLNKAGLNTPKTVCYGEKWGSIFEKRSFSITEKIPDAESLERSLPDYFNGPPTSENLKLRRDFIERLAKFVKKFHETGYRHRDLYLCHIFYDDQKRFFLIDLSRVFKPRLFARRFRVKDIAQLYYSAPGKYFSRTDRLRFFYTLTGCDKLSWKDKLFIRKVKNKAKRIARHDDKRGRCAPFEE